MAVDDLILAFQRAVDRLPRRLYRGEPEAQSFILRPAAVNPPSITQPTQIYGHFARYREAA